MLCCVTAVLYRSLAYLAPACLPVSICLSLSVFRSASLFLSFCRALNTVLLAINAQQRRAEYQPADSQAKAKGAGALFFPGTSVLDWCREWNELLMEAIGADNTSKTAAAGAAVVSSSLVHSIQTETHGLYVSFIRTEEGEEGTGASVLSNGRASSGTRQVDGDYALVRSYPSTDQDTVLDTVPEQDKDKDSPASASASVSPKAREPYDSNRLDILALGFTAVKLLFLRGRLGALPRLIRHLETARRASCQPLHETK